MTKKHWKIKSEDEIKKIVFHALDENINYSKEYGLGIPASYLDDKVFNQDTSFVKDAPFISTLIQNPNHIGCHTLGTSEAFFAGTQNIEKKLLDICAVDILKGETDEYDGYVASGGTEANIQAIWIYRNYYIREYNASKDEICIICSEDSHYSMDKAANLLGLDIYKVPVDFHTRQISAEGVEEIILKAKKSNKKYSIVISNMMTTMFGSVDDIESYTDPLEKYSCIYKLHVDGAFGGFYYPFTTDNNNLTFENKHITSFTLDAHKMAQAPYGTGIFLIRKDYIHYVLTEEASYIEGQDFTLIGSRSGANAVAAWMILVKNGPYGWQEKIFILQKRTEWTCNKLTNLKVDYYRHPLSNIITVDSKYISKETVTRFGLVPDNHKNPLWYKIVIMEHVTIEKLMELIDEIEGYLKALG